MTEEEKLNLIGQKICLALEGNNIETGFQALASVVATAIYSLDYDDLKSERCLIKFTEMVENYIARARVQGRDPKIIREYILKLNGDVNDN